MSGNGSVRAKCAWAVVVAAGVAWAAPLYAQVAPPTAPSAQGVPWRPAAFPAAFSPLNSIVEVNRFNAQGGIVEFGSGTVIGRQVRFENGMPIGWLCVLTADHVVNLGAASEYRVRFGNVAAQGSFGGATNLRFLAPDPVAQGGMNVPADLAVLGIRYGPVDNFFNQLTPIAPVVRSESSVVGSNFSQVGYGDTGEFVAAGGGNVAGIRRNSRDSIKGFQNNVIDNGADHMRARPGGGNYNFRAVEWDLDMPAAPAAMGPHPFLVAEGTSFPGDSGSPYLYTGADVQSVAAFTRPGAGSDWNPAGGMGDMPLFTTGLFAVHSFGDGTAVGSVRPYGAVSGGVLLTQAHVNWIGTSHEQIPAPAAFAPLFAMGLLAHRRRR